ncbi:MAG: pyruvate kinase [Eubacteriales bacterium]|nr:pyruvate kinase [Eubacteriales bacterium]
MRGKLYATLGPACAEENTLRAMFREGMAGMRLNLSHGMLEESKTWVEAMHAAAESEGVTPDLLIDLQGPELRIGRLDAPVALKEGSTVTLGTTFPVPECVVPNLVDGEELLLDDGLLLLRVEDAKNGVCRVVRGGTLASRKSLAVVGRELPAPALTGLDIENLRHARDYGVTGIMQPFVRGREDLEAVRRAMAETGTQDLKIFAKIENQTGLHKLDEILPLADVVICARGDLGQAMPLWELPRAQAKIAAECKASGRDFMISTQMLHSMHHSAVPTRAEVTDVYQAARSGASYLLLTGETAVGEYPVEAMHYFSQIACNGWEDAD